MALLTIDQDGLPPGIPGVSRSDGLRDGSTVTLSHNDPNAVFTSFELLWVPDDDGTALSSFTAVGNTATFSPDPTSIGGTYRIRLRVTTPTDTSETIRLFAIRTPSGLRIPALNERANEAASLEFNNSVAIEDSEFNEAVGSGPFQSGNYGGWYSAQVELYKRVEALSGGNVSTLWTSLFDLDLTAEATSNILPASTAATVRTATPTIQGQTMYVRSNSGPHNNSVDLVNGSGLVFVVGGSTFPGNAGNLDTASSISFNFSALPGYLPGRQYAIVAHVYNPLELNNSGVAVASWTPGTLDSARGFGRVSTFNAPGSSRFCSVFDTAVFKTDDEIITGATDYIFAHVRYSNLIGWGAQRTWDSTWYPIESLFGSGFARDPSKITAPTRLGIVLSAPTQGGSSTYTISRIQILQKDQ